MVTELTNTILHPGRRGLTHYIYNFLPRAVIMDGLEDGSTGIGK